MVKEITKSNSGIVFRPLPQDDPASRRPDISFAKQKLDWEPKVPIREGLPRTIAYFRKSMGARERLLRPVVE